MQFPHGELPWWEVVTLAFRLLVSRADGDEEIRDFLNDSKVTVTDLDGSTLWPRS